MFCRLEVTLGLLVSGFLVTHLSATDTMSSDMFFFKLQTALCAEVLKGWFLFWLLSCWLAKHKVCVILGVNHSHSAILLIASTLMNEKKKSNLLKLEGVRGNFSLFPVCYGFWRLSPERDTHKKAEFHSAWMEPQLITADLTLAVLCYRIYWGLWMEPATY